MINLKNIFVCFIFIFCFFIDICLNIVFLNSPYSCSICFFCLALTYVYSRAVIVQGLLLLSLASFLYYGTFGLFVFPALVTVGVRNLLRVLRVDLVIPYMLLMVFIIINAILNERIILGFSGILASTKTIFFANIILLTGMILIAYLFFLHVKMVKR